MSTMSPQSGSNESTLLFQGYFPMMFYEGYIRTIT